ncbi:MAG TPA: ribosome small subunit-dependent GTPase A [Dehalococcoidia bacterium]|nr:ribosome small subunit-dependent GTPase A [Dehalococcoidia bacterium]
MTELGWDSFFIDHFKSLSVDGCVPARVIAEGKHSCQVYSQYGELSARVSGRMRYESRAGDRYPSVGDWVVVKPNTGEQKCLIHAVLPRRSCFSRKMSDDRARRSGSLTREQVLAANVDTVFIVSGLDGSRNLNLRRLERYLTLAWESGAAPVIVLNKIDLCPDVDACIRNVEPVASGVPIHAVSATERLGLDALVTYLDRGKTAVFLGPSGVGKSALLNALLGIERQEVGEVRGIDRKGRHTTTRRELVLLPGGGAVIDTPGLREVQMWADEDSLGSVFKDIEQLANECRFRDCTHHTEPGCAIKAAVQQGSLDVARLQSYRKLEKELRHLATREDIRTRLEERAKWKKISKWSRWYQENPK